MIKYGKTSRILHSLVLGNPFLMKALFQLELDFFPGSEPADNRGKHVFISGLARSGTTSLLQKIYETRRFRSLTYRDMPFVLSPNLWRRFSPDTGKSSFREERAHGDGIIVGYESPEAFEEVFWKLYAGKSYIRDGFLEPHAVSEETIELFRQFAGAVLRSGEVRSDRYLSKNNNNILRLPAIFKAFPNAVVLTTFREPLSHAASLLNQHLRFLKTGSSDRFIQQYMSWLGHYEFGPGHKPFRFFPDQSPQKKYPPESINYWLSVWFDYYRFATINYGDQLVFVSFENLCAFPRPTLKILTGILEVDVESENITAFRPPVKEAADVDSGLVDQCRIIYRKLEEISVNQGESSTIP